MRLYPRRGLSHGQAAPDCADHGRNGARGGRVHNHRRHQGGRAWRCRRRLHQYRRRGRSARGRNAQRCELSARRRHPGIGYARRPRHRHHEPARGLGVFERHRKRCCAAQSSDCRRARRRPRHPLLPRPHARRPGIHAQRVCPGQRRCHGDRRGCRARAPRRAGGM